jgi:hypothetical protein
MTKDEALDLALEAWQTSVYGSESHHKAMLLAMTNMAQARSAPVQEPVAWTLLLVGEHHGIIGKAGDKFLSHPKHYRRVDVYTTPPAAQRQWIGLTDEEIADEFYKFEAAGAWYQFAREIEAKLKEKNGGQA